MDVRLSPEQRALRDSVARVVDQRGPHAVGQLDDEERAAKLDAAVAATGWRELRFPQHDGTPLASGVEVALIAEALARGLADTPFVGPTLAAELRRHAGAPASTAPETVLLGADLSSLATTIEGATAVDAAGASTALLLAKTSGGHSLAAVDLTDPSASVDLTRPFATPSESSVAVPDQASVITDAALTGWTALGITLTCADLLGTMTGAVQLACDYARERRQYGQPIGSFQAVQHLLADAHVSTEGSRSLVLYAAWAVDALAPDDALAAASVAKAYCARAARTVCETAIQVHGGIGNTWECLAHVYLRRALVSSDMFGGAGANLTRVLAHQGIGGKDGLR
jgi:alkylation response protein AidB-like acyl-CoA dehydrogenase